MNPFIKKIRANVREIAPYSLEHVDAQVQLDMNENPIDTPLAIKNSVIEKLQTREWTRYPELFPEALYRKLSSFVGWPQQGILVGNGSNELLTTTLLAVAGPGVQVTVVQPSFSIYHQLIQITGANYHEVRLTPELQFDVGSICRAIKHSDLTILCVPNNPTGTLLDCRSLRDILKVTSGLVLLDEAYHEFSQGTAFELLREFKNLIILRTFSKAMSLAGLRIGYLLADPDLVREIEKAKLPYNLNFVSIAAAEAALDHIRLLKANVKKVIALRESLCQQLQAIDGVEVFPSGANFILFRTPRPGPETFEALYTQSILVRDVSRAPLLGRCLRVTVGSQQDNDAFLDALRKVLIHAPSARD
jgi:histidinol-phosphate aminotransferase